jgi:hypothetical protein
MKAYEKQQAAERQDHEASKLSGKMQSLGDGYEGQLFDGVDPEVEALARDKRRFGVSGIADPNVVSPLDLVSPGGIINVARGALVGRLAVASEKTATSTMISTRSLLGIQAKSEMTGSRISRIAKDMKVNGFRSDEPIQAVKIDNKNYILDGLHRVEAAKRAGIAEVPTMFNEVSPERASDILGAYNNTLWGR